MEQATASRYPSRRISGPKSPSTDPPRSGDVHLVLPRHTLGQLAEAAPGELPPPIGLLTLAACCRRELPDRHVEVFDENRVSRDAILARLDAPIVGLSCWFSNYASGLELARAIKRRKPETTIVLGGPHPSGLGGELILRQRPEIDLVVTGDGEQAFLELLRGRNPRDIAGVWCRRGDTVAGNPRTESRPLDSIPPLSLAPLATPYRWRPWTRGWSALRAFPISGVRGCPVYPRCQYCSIATVGVLRRRPELFWQEILALRRKEGIDFFFETGDVFPLSYARDLLAARLRLGRADRMLLEGVALKVYLRPWMVSERTAALLAAIGVKLVFIGYESVLCFEREGQRARGWLTARHPGRTFSRRYDPRYSAESVPEEIALLARHDIDVMPSFVLGLPGEDPSTLGANQDLITAVAEQPSVTDLLVNVVLPLPGSEFFDWCLGDDVIRRGYRDATGAELLLTDALDHYLLARLFVERFTTVSYEAAEAALAELVARHEDKTAYWSPHRFSARDIPSRPALAASAGSSTW